MISFLQGTLAHIAPAEIIIDVHGVGFLVNIPLSTYEQLQGEKGQVKLHTYLHVREDAMSLYGFATEAERKMFQLLISVTGIGPKMAQGILSGISVNDLRAALASSSIASLTSITGVGKKTAERIIIELRDKIPSGDLMEPRNAANSAQLKTQSEATIALMSLGHSRPAAEEALRKVLANPASRDLSVEELIKRALQHTTR
jgi:Holliday junction DNA helicase RuvA